MKPRISPAGDRALLIDLGPVDAVELHAYAAAMRRRRDVIGCIAGARSLYVVFDREPPEGIAFETPGFEERGGRIHTIEVRFDGADLEEFFRRVDRDAFFSRLPALTLSARYLGFRAGFAYLDGWPAEWAMARRPTSRQRVPRGSFAIAAAVAGFYPIDSPGGWNLLGQTDAPLWDARRAPPNLIAAGDRVTIVPVTRSLALPEILEEPPRPDIGAEFSGRLAAVVGPVDWSRLDQGLAPGGPFDPEMAAAANRLVGNDEGAPLLECAMADPKVFLREPRVVAWCGAMSDLPDGEPFVAGGELKIGRIRDGLRGWLAIGASPARTGASVPRMERDADRRVIRVVAGPHESPLRTIECEVTPQLDRVGIRLRPLAPLAPLGITAPADLLSCGMQFGTIQLHPDGSLVAMGPDHPITGGYLQPLTVRWDERWKLAQLSPGERVVLTTE